MKEKKAKLKERNPYAFYRNGYLGCKIGKYLSILAPFITIFSLKFEEYFYVSNADGTQTKMSLGCVLACIVGGIAVYRELRKNDEGEKNNDFTNIVGWGLAFAFCYFFQSILQDLTLIVFCGLIGQIAALGFEFGAQNRRYYMREYRKAKIQNQVISQASKEAFKVMSGQKNNDPID